MGLPLGDVSMRLPVVQVVLPTPVLVVTCIPPLVAKCAITYSLFPGNTPIEGQPKRTFSTRDDGNEPHALPSK